MDASKGPARRPSSRGNTPVPSPTASAGMDGGSRWRWFVIGAAALAFLVTVQVARMGADALGPADAGVVVRRAREDVPARAAVSHNEKPIAETVNYPLQPEWELRNGRVLVTGAAGFIGYSVASRLAEMGVKTIIGVDNFNDYYSVKLKQDRASDLYAKHGVVVQTVDVCEHEKIASLFAKHNFTHVIHLAAQAGVRYSIQNPQAYVRSNVECFVSLLENMKPYSASSKLVYASSSSVYGGNTHTPFSELDRVDKPVSLYAATKKENELIAHVYHKLFGVRCIGLRFFTVYGPWGRPDMAMFIFGDNIMKGVPIHVSEGDVRRDFTYIDDIVTGVIGSARVEAEYEIFNLGNHDTVELRRFITAIETAAHKQAKIIMKPLPPGDVQATFSDIERAHHVFAYQPETSVEKGAERFIEWYLQHDGGQYRNATDSRRRLDAAIQPAAGATLRRHDGLR